MGDQKGFPPDEHEPDAEGVRIIGADEAAEAVERGDVARRREHGAPRFGDRPSVPQGPRPTLRFPLSDAGASPGERPKLSAEPPDPSREERRKRSLFSVEEEGEAGAEPARPDAPEPAEEDVEQASAPVDPDASGEVTLPHWTEPATGEVPQVVIGDDAGDESPDWTAMAAGTPRWRDSSDDYDDDDDLTKLVETDPALAIGDGSGSDDEIFSFGELDEDPSRAREPAPPEPPRARRSGERRPGSSRRGAPPQRRPAPGPQPPGGPGRPSDPAPPGERNLPVAVGVGVAVGVLALVLFSRGPAFTMALVVVIIALAAAELFETIRRAGYQPAQLLGLVATVAFPLAVYWRGEAAYPLMIFLVLLFGFLWYLAGAGGQRPVMNLGVTVLGVAYVGGLGAFGALLLRDPIDGDGVSLLLAVALVTVAYDVGAFFVGRSMGATPLSRVSPSKTLEGLGGGGLAALLVSVIVVFAIGGISVFGASLANSLWLALVVVAAATLGDLAESITKRDLGVKDMGSILPGHGGVLDRFDGLLFAMPAAYYLAQILR